MAVITHEIATDIVLPNITVERQYFDGVHKAYRLTPNEGYVLHAPSLDGQDPMTGEPVPYYYRQATIPVVRPVDDWDWEAVLESEVPADSIFGGGNNDHEVA